MKIPFAGKLEKEVKATADWATIKPGLSEEFQDLFEQRVKPRLSDIEKVRVSMLGVHRVLKWTLLPASVIGGVVLGFILSPIAFFVVLGIAMWLMKWPVKRYSGYYKTHIMGSLISAFGEFRYESKGCIVKEHLESFAIFPRHNIARGEDYISGESEGVALEFCELKLIESCDENSKTVFEGCAFLLTMPFEFDGHTVAKKDKGKLFNLAASVFGSKSRVTLENPDFEKLFEVQSDNPHDARYILSPGMMDRILALNALFVTEAQGRSLCFEFKKNQALFMVDYKGDLLEAPDIRTTVYDLKNLPLIEKELSMVIGIIKQLKLDYLVQRKNAVNNVVSQTR